MTQHMHELFDSHPSVQASEIADILTPVTQDLIALGVNTKQAHWHIRGANFLPIHEFLDDVHEHANEAADTVAERIIALGSDLPATIHDVAKHTRVSVMAAGFQQWEATVQEMVTQIDATLSTLYGAIKRLETVDPVSQDLVIAVAHQLDKDRWFLMSHLQR